MSEFDLLQDAFAGDLVARLGSEDAVEFDTVEGKKKFAAIVGRLRVERVIVQNGNREELEDRETCQVTVECDAKLLHIRKPVLAFRYATGDASTHDGQRFTVRSIDSYRDGWVTVQLWREFTAQIQRRGFEGATV